MRSRSGSSWWLMAVVFLVGGDVSAQARELTDDELSEAVSQVAQHVRQTYLFEDVAHAMADHVVERHASGAYDRSDVDSFSRLVTQDLLSISSDRHMYLRWDPEQFASYGREREGERSGPTPEMIELFRRRAADRNNGIAEVSWLAEQVGYVRVSGWHPMRFAEEKLAATMEVLQGASALIVDVRGNGGGSADMVGALQGYFMEPGAKLLDFKNRSLGQSQPRFVAEEVEGSRLPEGIPVYVLADGNSGSASEDFAYTVKHAGRGLVVGEQTAGAGHMNVLRPVSPGFMVSVSWAGPISPVTGGNWEGVGVRPDLETLSPVALQRAQIELYRERVASAEGPDRERLNWRVAQLEREIDALLAPRSELQQFSGTFGAVAVEARGTFLAVARDGRRPRYYSRVVGDEFEAELGTSVVRFERSGSRIVALSLEEPGRPSRRLEREAS